MNGRTSQRRVTKAYAIQPQRNPLLEIRHSAPSFNGYRSRCSRRSRHIVPNFLSRCGLVVIGMFLAATIAAAQPPPLGPPPNHTEEQTFSVGFITNFVRTTAQQSVDATNVFLRATGKDERASLESITQLSGDRRQTTTINKPNSWSVVVPYFVKIHVSIPNALDRYIIVPVDVRFLCDGWHTDKGGRIVVRGEPGPASIEGGSFIEVFGVRDYIDGQVKASFTRPQQTVTTLVSQCSDIGYSDKGTPSILDDEIVWDTPAKSFRGRDLHASAPVNPTIEVTFNKLKRLRARSLPDNGILYNEVEQIIFHGFANYSEAQKSLSMREGDEVALGFPAIRLDPQKFDLLVVIGGIEQPPDNPRDSAYVSADKSLNYSPGTHQLQIPKWYSSIDQHTHKPIFSSVSAYELTYTVSFSGLRNVVAH